MKLQWPKRDEKSATLTQTLLLVLVCSLSVILTAYASDPTAWNDPAWWTASGGPVLQQVVTTTDGVATTNFPANYYAAANQGQLKLFTARAATYLNATLTNNGGAGTTLSNVVYGWQQDYLTNAYSSTNIKPSDYQVINLGQLKYVAGLVYGQLASAGYMGLTPSWLQPNPNTDYMAANLGQLKTAFNFNLSVAPPSVTGLTVGNSNPDELDLSWSLPVNNNAQSFTLLQSTDGGTTWTTVATLNPTATSYDVTGLENATNYSYLLEANNQAGSSVSATTTPTSPPPPIPTSPTWVSGSLTNSYYMNVFWPPSPGAARYAIDRETVTNGLWTTNFASSTSTNYVDTSYTNTGFRYRVSAVNSAGGTSTPSGVFPLPRYALIDLGIDFLPVGLSTNGIVAGNEIGDYDDAHGGFGGNADQTWYFSYGGATWQNGGPVQALHNSWSVQSINSSGVMVGQMTNSSGIQAASWATPNSTPVNLGFDHLISDPPDDSNATAISDNGTMVGFTFYDENYDLIGTQFNSDSLLMNQPTGDDGNIPLLVYPTAAQGSHWAGNYFNNTTTPTAGVVIDGTEIPVTNLVFEPDEGGSGYIQSTYGVNAINSSGLAVGEVSAGAATFTSTNSIPTMLGQGQADAVNSKGQIAGSDTYFPYYVEKGDNNRLGPNALIWEETNYNGTTSANYVQKSLNDLIPGATGWILNAATGINDQSIIVGSATYLGTNSNIISGPHGFMLLPYSLTNLADPYRGMTNTAAGIQNPGHNGQDTRIDLSLTTNSSDINAIAWIAAHDPNNVTNGVQMPRMPELQANIADPTGCQVLWKLQVTFHDRHGNPHRDFDTGDPNDSNTSARLMTDPMVTPTSLTSTTPDQVIIPNPANPTGRSDETSDGWKIVTNGNPWAIYQDPDWTAAISQAGFFGGDAELSVKITNSNGNTTILPEQDYYFRIAGEKPNSTLCQAYLTNSYGGPNASQALPQSPHTWFAWAIAKDETQGEGSTGYYNHFLNNGKLPQYPTAAPTWFGRPNWNDDGTKTSGAQTDRLTGTGGYGLYQLTYASRNNTNDTPDANYIMPRNWIWNWTANPVGFGIEIPRKITAGQNLYNALLSKYVDNGAIPSYGNFSGLDATIVTEYNGMSGGQMTVNNELPLPGYRHPQHSCWVPNGTTGWIFLQNINSYASNVNASVSGP